MKDLILHFFQAKAFPELATAVRARSANVLSRWENAVKEILPTADELTRAQLRNSLPETIENLAKALESSHASHTRTLLAHSEEHGAIRFVQAAWIKIVTDSHHSACDIATCYSFPIRNKTKEGGSHSPARKNSLPDRRFQVLRTVRKKATLFVDLLFKEREQVGIDDIGLRCDHAVWVVLVRL